MDRILEFECMGKVESQPGEKPSASLGRSELREGKPEIEIVSADQIKGLNSQTER
jgi:hypothetical protein